MNPLRDGSKKIGQLLVDRGWASGDQVLRAILCQRNLGGRLGTCLLELDVVSEEHLLEMLAEQQGSPAADLDRLRSIPHEVIDLVPREMAERCRTVPFAATERLLDVATPNARNVVLLDELAFATGRRVRPHVVNEVRIHEALSKCYGVTCPGRYRKLLDRLNASRLLWAKPREPLEVARAGDQESLPGDVDVQVAWNAPEEVFAAPDPLRSPSQALPYLAAPPSAAAETASAETASAETASAETASAETASAETASAETGGPGRKLLLSDVDRLLGHADGVSAIGEVLISFMQQHFDRCALFRVRQDALTPWLCHGEDFDPRLFRALLISLREPSVFLNLERGAEFHMGALPPMPAHKKMVRCWGDEWPAECLLLPVRLRDRMVVALYGDRGHGRLDGIRIDDWKALTAMAADALEVCILRKKLQAN